jgi:hypothetical protein
LTSCRSVSISASVYFCFIEKITPTTVRFNSFKGGGGRGEDVSEIGVSAEDPIVLSGFKRFIGLTGEEITGGYTNGTLPDGVTTNHNDEILFKCRAHSSLEQNLSGDHTASFSA